MTCESCEQFHLDCRECIKEIQMKDITYFGKQEGPDRQVVSIRHSNGNVTFLKQRIVLHSPTGFGWGYGGSGPADLALNMLYDYLLRTKYKGARAMALDLHQSFKWGFIATQTGDLFVTGKHIAEWIKGAGVLNELTKLAGDIKLEETIIKSLIPPESEKYQQPDDDPRQYDGESLPSEEGINRELE